MFNVQDLETQKNRFKYECWDMKMIQLVFEYYCIKFKAAAPRI
jgi:hypothetical protein